jgi:transcriptional regulator with XRE-family HTH domain
MSQPSFKTALIEARKSAGFTQGQLADSLGLERGRIAQIEQGVANPSIALVRRWLNACGLDLHTRSIHKCPRCSGSMPSSDAMIDFFFHTCP